MQSMDWTQAHSDALRELLATGLSYARIAEAINAKFNTAYTRNATLGRAKRMGLAGPARAAISPEPVPRAKTPPLHRLRERKPAQSWPKAPAFERTETTALRCVEIDPRHLSLLQLERGDCRYPYGGDEEGETMTFCGHPRRAGTSYCAPHFELTRVPANSAERASAVAVLLRLLEVA